MKELTADWKFERVSIGYPGDVRHGHPVAEPLNLGDGWVEFDYAAAFGCPVRIMNDACMQALGSYEGGRMLYLGLGTSIGSAFIFDGTIIPLASAICGFTTASPLKNVSIAKRWRPTTLRVAEERRRGGTAFKGTFLAEYIVMGGGNTEEARRNARRLPAGRQSQRLLRRLADVGRCEVIRSDSPAAWFPGLKWLQ